MWPFKRIPKPTVQYDTRPAKATFTMQDGAVHVVSRKGAVHQDGLGTFVWTGEELLERYCSRSKRTILVDDDGQMFATCAIKSIETVVGSNVVTVEE